MSGRIAEGWITVPVGEIAEVQLGKMLSADARRGRGTLPYLRNINVRWGRVDVTDLLSMDFTDAEVQKFSLRRGDLLVCEGGEPGRAAVWRGELEGVLYQKALHRVRGVGDALNPHYLAYHLQLDASTGRLARSFTGSTIKHLTREALLSYPVHLAPRAEQDRIVQEIETQLSRLDSGVLALRRTKLNLKRYRASVLKAACEGRLVPTEAELARREGREYESAEVMLRQIVGAQNQSEPPRRKLSSTSGHHENAAPLPAGWIWTTVQQLASTASGGTPKRGMSRYFGGNIPWVKSGELGDGEVRGSEESITEAGLRQSSAKIFPAGTLCIALYGATVGKLGLLRLDAATNQAVCGIFLPPQLVTRYMFYYLRSIRSQLIARGKGGAQPNISQDIVRQTLVPLPPLAEQHRIVAEVERRLSTIDKLEEEVARGLRRAGRLRQSILKRAFEGKLVRQDPNDEPASVLLERIQAARATQPSTSRSRRRTPATP